MKTRLFALLLACMTFAPPSAFAQNNSKDDQEKLSTAIYQLAGIFAGVNAENYAEARTLALELIQIKNERISSANARGVYNLGTKQLKALIRIRYLQLNVKKQAFNSVERTAYDKFMSMSEADLKTVNEIASTIPSQQNNILSESDAFWQAKREQWKARSAGQQSLAPQTSPNQVIAAQPQLGVLAPAAQPVYITKIDKDKDDVLVLDNGAVVEITQGFLGFVGFRKNAVLYREGGTWKVWIEGKKSYPCDVLRAPENPPSGQGEVISISAVKGEGNFVTGLDGSLFEVDDLQATTTSLWLAPFEALLIDETQLINLEEGDEIIDVTKLR